MSFIENDSEELARHRSEERTLQLIKQARRDAPKESLTLQKSSAPWLPGGGSFDKLQRPEMNKLHTGGSAAGDDAKLKADALAKLRTQIELDRIRTILT